MNAVTTIIYNTTVSQLELTKKAIASVFDQTVPVSLWVYDNGSTESTMEWLEELQAPSPHAIFNVEGDTENKSPVKIANMMMKTLFEQRGCDYILGIPNDVELPKNFYCEMLEWPRGIVTASMTEYRFFEDTKEPMAVSESTPMAVPLIRRWAYDALVAKDGYFFDERFFHYASDCDLALRMAACGIRGVQLDMQYFHHGSASWKLATPGVSQHIRDVADDDRQKFFEKWGFTVGSEEYGKACGNLNFRG
jgi:hypothetical protein